MINLEKQEFITQELLQALFLYNAETGIFTRKITTGTQKSLGYYNTAIEAGEAYQKAAKELHGEFYNEATS